MKFLIHYGNGFTDTVIFDDLDAAKEYAVDNMRYTGLDVKIEDVLGNLLSVSCWQGYAPSDDDVYLERFGTSGFYADWVDF